VRAVDEQLRSRLTEAQLQQITAAIPDHWLGKEAQFATPEEHRTGYLAYLTARLAAADIFVQEALNAHAALV
jgi:hypothetical protein